MKVSDYKALYASEAEETLQALESGIMGLEGAGDETSRVEEIFRAAHNLKGMSGAMGYDAVVEASHSLENVLDRCRRGELSIGSTEVDLLLRTLDLLKDLTHAAINGERNAVTEELLGNILVLLSPMSARGPDADRRSHGPANDADDAGDTADAGAAAGADGANEADDAAGADDADKADDAADTGAPAAPPRAPAPDKKTGMREKSYPKVISTRVSLESLERLMDLVGELIISRIRLTGLAREIGYKPLIEELNASGRLVSEIQKEVMEARLVPVGEIFQRFKRLVRDISRELGKNVELELVGSEIGLDRTVLESMVEPLVHLVRNALDHGIESPEERRAAGKPEKGRIELSARRDRNFVIIEISDDGRGIDHERIVEKNVGRGGEGDGAALTDEELCSILTTPGFSTSETVGRYSGRGMGMDIVKKKVDSFGGSMFVRSERREGTTVSLQLPINLSIIKALLFHVGEDVHAIPIEYVSETMRVERGTFKSIRGKQVLPVEGGTLPLLTPGELFGFADETESERYIKVIVTETGMGKVGLVVNRIIGQQEVVIKGLPTMIRGIGGISGATILGSGKIAFIWDLRALFKGRCTDEPNQETVVFAD